MKNLLKKIALYILCSLGVCFLAIIILLLTQKPFWWYYYLGRNNSEYSFTPKTLILLGGSGMPSESNLMRAYYALQLKNKFPKAEIILALPEDTIEDESSLQKLRNYLIAQGIDSLHIKTENKGRNTRQQALNIAERFSDIKKQNVVVITSPENIYRSIACFKKLGFTNIGGEPCFDFTLESDLNYNDNLLKGNRTPVKIGSQMQIRYQFWTHLKYQILVYREWLAISYYYLMDWI